MSIIGILGAGFGIAGAGVAHDVSVQPVLLTLVRGDDYLATDGRAFDFVSTTWPNLTAASIAFSAYNLDTLQNDISSSAGSVVAPTSPATVRIPLTHAQTQALEIANKGYAFDVQATLSDGSRVTLVRGYLTVLADYTA